MSDTTVTITLQADGQIKLGVAGPGAGNKVIMIGLLEVAKSAILEPKPAESQQARPSLLLPIGPLPNGAGKR